ncbi:methyltransferase domain-containing protein [Jannaschia sp. Os4]|uniref:class I SAM-dependent DNA methyltransferase n=1 Tax=Jannaschia sp. Os4 TaxID=2807617 RepID=UPI00193A73B2|nr:methyltransferase domain-containing protein [Jannaschia sp. Os4]MBM2576442.1 methyltransferase domain-containing protein [Jannaschia sp. Os4]
MIDLPQNLWSAGRTPEDTRRMYAEWASRYEADMAESGYLGAARTAGALARLVGTDVAVHDFGCGTGLAGLSLREAGFARIDGSDLTPEMIAIAEGKGVYRSLAVSDPDAPIRFADDVGAVCAAGVISVGAGPAALLGAIVDAMRPGMALALTMNQDTIVERDYLQAVADVQIDGRARLEHAEHVRQFEKLDRHATIMAFRRL